MKRLLVIGPEPPPLTGMEVATRALVDELRRAGVPVVRVDTADRGDDLGNRARWTPHNVTLAARHLGAVARAAFRRDVGAVYLPITQEFPGFFRDAGFILLGRLARKPVVVHLHAGNFAAFVERSGRAARTLIRATVGKSALGIVLAEGLRPALECVLPPERVVVVRNGLDLVRTPAVARTDDSVVAFFLSTLFVQKGILAFVEALALARREVPGLRGSVAGYWPDAETERRTRALVAERGLDGAIEFHGPVEGARKAQLFAAADLFCFPSIQVEGQPLVVIEAMAAGLPVVAMEGPGVADCVVEGETGLLVAERSPEALAERLVRLAGDAEARHAYGRAGRERYERLFTQRAFGDRMLEVLAPLLGVRRAPNESLREAA